MLVGSNFNVCVICGELRSKRVHKKCSRILKKRSQDPIYMEEQKRIHKNVKKANLLESLDNTLSARINAIIHNK